MRIRAGFTCISQQLTIAFDARGICAVRLGEAPVKAEEAQSDASASMPYPDHPGSRTAR